jgi:hypothetical protein
MVVKKIRKNFSAIFFVATYNLYNIYIVISVTIIDINMQENKNYLLIYLDKLFAITKTLHSLP